MALNIPSHPPKPRLLAQLVFFACPQLWGFSTVLEVRTQVNWLRGLFRDVFSTDKVSRRIQQETSRFQVEKYVVAPRYHSTILNCVAAISMTIQGLPNFKLRMFTHVGTTWNVQGTHANTHNLSVSQHWKCHFAHRVCPSTDSENESETHCQLSFIQVP